MIGTAASFSGIGTARLAKQIAAKPRKAIQNTAEQNGSIQHVDRTKILLVLLVPRIQESRATNCSYCPSVNTCRIGVEGAKRLRD